MASRHGAREPGTDGSDFKYRESVASQHTTSLAVKSRLKRYFVLNILVCLGQVALYVVSSLKPFTEAPKLQPEPWQALLTVSIAASFTGLAALPKNRSGLLRIHNVALAFFGIGGVAWGVASHYESVMDLWDGVSVEEVFGIPKVLLVYNMAVLIFALQMSTIFGTRKLMSIWNYRKSK